MIERKIMSATRAEFFRSLDHFTQAYSANEATLTGALREAIDESRSQFEFPLGNGAGVISFSPLPDRQVTGLLSLPQMEVLIEFNGADEAGKAEFMKIFDLSFRRGGG